MAKQTFTTGQVLTAAQMTSLQQTAMGGGSTTAKVASYVLVAADAGTVVQMNSASATTITVNTALFAAGDTVEIQNVGAGACTITAGTATVSTSATLILKQYDAGSLYFNTTSAALFFAVDAADSPLTTKGDLFTFSTAAARLAVGSDGETLIADSAATTGLRYQPTQAAGKNGVINGAFDNWQRGTSGFTASQCFNADRWNKNTNTAFDVSRQLTGDTTNLPFIQYCARVQRTVSSTSTTTIEIAQSIDNDTSYNYLGRTVTYSFYARKGANYSGSTLSAILYGGTGTNQNVLVTGFTGLAAQVSTAVTLTTTWQRFQATATIGSTITQLAAYFAYSPSGTAGANDYIEVTGVQLEVGSIATAFTRAGGTIQGELAACQRYYWRWNAATQFATVAIGAAVSSTVACVTAYHPVQMRTIVSAIDGTANGTFRLQDQVTGFTQTAASIEVTQQDVLKTELNVTVASGLTQYRFLRYGANNSTSTYLGFSAEL